MNPDELYWGVVCGSHDASMAVIQDSDLKFAAHAERYTRIKNDSNLNVSIVEEALSFGEPSKIFYYEKPWLKRLRYLRSGQWDAFMSEDPHRHIRSFLPTELKHIPIVNTGHHLSHAASGVFTKSQSNDESAVVIVADAIGEFDCLSLWLWGSLVKDGHKRKLRKIKSVRYPHSLGLLYSAFTQRCGFKPNEEEYIMMGMAAYGNPNNYSSDILEYFFKKWGNPFDMRLSKDVHRGIGDWAADAPIQDLAAAIQNLTERFVGNFHSHARDEMTNLGWTMPRRLIYMGGIALNCVANCKLRPKWDDVWIMPNPGDAGSCIGAVLAHTKTVIGQFTPYLGTNVSKTINPREVAEYIKQHKMVGICHGRAEFGPRALGNRSLLADASDPNIKEIVNKVKGREPFRPFAPVMRYGNHTNYFDTTVLDHSYMQYAVRATNATAKMYPGIVHVDGTSRLQTVTPIQNHVLHEILSEWTDISGHPILLNTSLNIKGEPLVNDEMDARRFERTTGVKVF